MDEALFSHPATAEYVRPADEGSPDPVAYPIFSDQQK